MDESGKSFREFVGQWRKEIGQTWDQLSPEKRNQLFDVLGWMPKDHQGWRKLIEQAIDHVRLAAGDYHQVAIVGPVNVGKSTLYNQLIHQRMDRAKVSAVPGTTRKSQKADAGLFRVIDTPGADAVGPVGEDEKEQAFAAAEASNVLVILFDASHGIHKAEKDLFGELLALEKPSVVGLNKIDLVKRERAAVIGKAAKALDVNTDQILPLSAKKGQGLERLLLAIAKTEPRIVAALGAALPEYRWMLAQAVIAKAASTAATIAITPLPFLDFIPLIGVQTAMVLGIARIYAYQITPSRVRELIATFGLGLLGRTLFYEISKLGGPPAWLVGAAVATGITVGMGYASILWFDRGERVSREALQRIIRIVSETTIERLKHIGRRRPKSETLRERISQALDDLPAPDVASQGENRTS